MTTTERTTIQRFERNYILREWWTVTKTGQATIPVFFCPAQTQAEVLARYPGAGAVPA